MTRVTVCYITSKLMIQAHVALSGGCNSYYVTLQYVTLQYITLYYNTLHYNTLQYITLQYSVLHNVTLALTHVALSGECCITLHYNTLH